VADNVNDADGYARWYKYPSTQANLQALIEEAFTSRISRAALIINTRERKIRNSICP
jgi:hypothetical protein